MKNVVRALYSECLNIQRIVGVLVCSLPLGTRVDLLSHFDFLFWFRVVVVMSCHLLTIYFFALHTTFFIPLIVSLCQKKEEQTIFPMPLLPSRAQSRIAE